MVLIQTTIEQTKQRTAHKTEWERLNLVRYDIFASWIHSNEAKTINKYVISKWNKTRNTSIQTIYISKKKKNIYKHTHSPPTFIDVGHSFIEFVTLHTHKNELDVQIIHYYYHFVFTLNYSLNFTWPLAGSSIDQLLLSLFKLIFYMYLS